MQLPPLSAQTALFLDFDGTLAPIVAQPDLAAVSAETRDAVGRLHGALGGAVAVISGRELSDLAPRLAPLDIALSGGHGAQRRTPGGAVIDASAPLAPDALDTLLAPLARIAAENSGLLLERKARGGALHYRARPELQAACAEAAARAAGGDPTWRVIAGKMVFEIAPAAETKAGAVAAFLAEPPFAGRTPVAVGDDVTDEDMFAAAAEAGGWSIKVGAGETRADHRAADVAAFTAWLSAEADRLTRDPSPTGSAAKGTPP